MESLQTSKGPMTSERDLRGLLADGFDPGLQTGPDAVSVYIEEVHHRADTLSPLLQELLAFRPPPHWGINE